MGRRNVHAPGFTHLASRDVSEFLTLLNKEGINQALVEAGGVFLSALMRANLIDELVIYQAPKLLGSGKRWIENLGINSLSEAMEWELLGTYQLGPDVKTHYRRADK
jgi:diaminohydroxyphosphoribosylaminopyrimidine deaminase/5-amino-6-(5-phosphoribosylamino)uracil reductase